MGNACTWEAGQHSHKFEASLGYITTAYHKHTRKWYQKKKNLDLFNLASKYQSQGSGESLAGNVLGIKAWRLEFSPQCSGKKPGVVVCACYPSTERLGHVDLCSPLVT